MTTTKTREEEDDQYDRRRSSSSVVEETATVHQAVAAPVETGAVMEGLCFNGQRRGKTYRFKRRSCPWRGSSSGGVVAIPEEATMAHPVEIHPVAEVLHPMEGEIRPMAEGSLVMEELHLAVTDHLAEVHLAGDHPEATAHPEEAHPVGRWFRWRKRFLQ